MVALTVVVCTYNRGGLLVECLRSLALQQYSKDKYEVLIIDNNSTDNTEKICKEFVEIESNFRYIKEPKQGLGYARNCGYVNAKANWVAYVDDDAKAHLNYIERALWVIENCHFDCFGGVYNAWYTVKKPKWISNDFGTNRSVQNFTGLLEKGYMSGGNMVWKKSVLEKLGGFHTEIGMKGKKISFGEETYIQEIAKREGVKIGFDPILQIDHYVQPYKLSVIWEFKSSYATGLDYWQAFDKRPSRQDASSWNYQYVFRGLLKDLFRKIPKLIRTRGYYWQNYLLEVVVPCAISLGKIKSAKRFLKRNLKVSLQY